MLALMWARGLVTRRGGRLLAAAGGIALAVALLTSIGMFLASSRRSMTARSIASVAVDWQIEAQPGADPAAMATSVAASPGVASSAVVDFGNTTGFVSTVAGSTQTTGPGVVLGLPDNYRRLFPGQLRDLTGATTGVLLVQQTAANLHASVGTTVSVGRVGLPPLTLRVAGVVDLPAADSLFQRIGTASTAQPQAPPDNVLVLPSRLWHQAFDPLAALRPDQVRTQVHVRLDRRLPGDPAAAYAKVTGAARHLELQLAGAGLVGDNLGAALAAARSDAVYAQALFLLLGGPGAVLAALLTAAVAGAGRPRRRREQALLRTRGATVRQLVGLALIEAALVGVVGVVLGLVVAVAVSMATHDTGRFGGTRGTIMWSASAVGVGLLIASLTIAVPAARDAKALSVASARQPVGRAGAPRWLRYGIDVVLLGAAGIVFWLTSRSGYQLVLAVEGVPTISVSYWSLFGPLLFWAGAGLLAWRLCDALLRHRQGAVRRAVRPVAGSLAGTVAATMTRQRRLLASGVALLALTIAYAISTSVFNTTYRHQVGVDALLTNGADVTVTVPPGSSPPAGLAATLARLPGVRRVETLQHRYVYVGADLQDLYGVDPTTIVSATTLQDAYFGGGTAKRLMAQLTSRPDAILVSAETVHDFQLAPGDRVTLRLQNTATNALAPVPFHYVGVAKEFPTAPSDSFVVANQAYIAAMTGSAAASTYLVDTGGQPVTPVAERVRAAVGTSATVTDIVSSRRIVGSSLTAVDLAGLTRIELGFAVALAAAATGLVLWLGLTERRRAFTIASALGATPRQLGGFVWSEAGFVTIVGLALGALTGGIQANMLTKVLTGVFDPPPASLAVPWRYLAIVLLVVVIAEAVAAQATILRARRPSLELLRET